MLYGTKAIIKDPLNKNFLGLEYIVHLNATVYKHLKGKREIIQPLY